MSQAAASGDYIIPIALGNGDKSLKNTDLLYVVLGDNWVNLRADNSLGRNGWYIMCFAPKKCPPYTDFPAVPIAFVYILCFLWIASYVTGLCLEVSKKQSCSHG